MAFEEWEPADIEEWEAIQRKKKLEKDPDWQELQHTMSDMWREPSKKDSEEIEAAAREKRAAQSGYETLRDEISYQLMEAGIDDFELYGAGRYGEQLSPLEYKGALRVIGPPDEVAADKFMRIVQNIARGGGYNVEMDRPPSVTHAFGQTIRGGIPAILEHRPILYIYKRYKTTWPSPEERELARNAGASREDQDRMRGSLRFYESRVSQLASEITDDPHDFAEAIPSQIATQIGDTAEFKIIREEINDANSCVLHLRRAINMPVAVGDQNIMIHFLAEANGGNTYIDLLDCPNDIKNEVLNILSKTMLA